MILKDIKRKLVLWVLIGVGMVHFSTVAQAQSTDDKDEVLQEKVSCFKTAVEGYLMSDLRDVFITPYFMNSDDLDYWMGQFEFTPEVLDKMSWEEFYNQLEGWSEQAAYTFRDGVTGADAVEVVETRFKYGEQPGLRVSQSVNLELVLYQKEEAVGRMILTLINVRGQLKLISVK